MALEGKRLPADSEFEAEEPYDFHSAEQFRTTFIARLCRFTEFPDDVPKVNAFRHKIVHRYIRMACAAKTLWELQDYSASFTRNLKSVRGH